MAKVSYNFYRMVLGKGEMKRSKYVYYAGVWYNKLFRCPVALIGTDDEEWEEMEVEGIWW